MLKDHKYLRFRPFSDKANDLILFQVLKFTFCDIFPKILVFPNNRVLSILNPYVFNFMHNNQENQWADSEKSLCYGWTKFKPIQTQIRITLSQGKGLIN